MSLLTWSFPSEVKFCFSTHFLLPLLSLFYLLLTVYILSTYHSHTLTNTSLFGSFSSTVIAQSSSMFLLSYIFCWIALVFYLFLGWSPAICLVLGPLHWVCLWPFCQLHFLMQTCSPRSCPYVSFSVITFSPPPFFFNKCHTTQFSSWLICLIRTRNFHYLFFKICWITVFLSKCLHCNILNSKGL